MRKITVFTKRNKNEITIKIPEELSEQDKEYFIDRVNTLYTRIFEKKG